MSMILNPYRFAAAGGWLPSDESDLLVWLMADSSTIQDTSSGAISDGESVGLWQDQSGNGFDFEDDGSTPTFSAAGWSGNDALDFGTAAEFGSTENKAITSTASISAASDYTIAIIGSSTQSSTVRYMVDSVAGRFILSSDGSYYDGSFKTPSTPIGVGDHIWLWKLTSGASVVRGDGADILTGGSYTQTAMGTRTRIGRDQRGFPERYGIGGVLAEVIIYSSPVSFYEKIEGYLAHKYGFQSLLPSGHTYKSSAP